MEDLAGHGRSHPSRAGRGADDHVEVLGLDVFAIEQLPACTRGQIHGVLAGRHPRSAFDPCTAEDVGCRGEHSFEGRQHFELIREIAGYVRVSPCNASQRDRDARLFRNRRQDLCAKAAGIVVFVDDHQTGRLFRRCQHGLLVPWRKRPQIEYFRLNADLLQFGGGHLAQANRVSPGDQRNVTAGTDQAAGADGNELCRNVRAGGRGGIVQTALRVEEQGRPLRVERCIQQAGGVACRGRNENVDAWHMGHERFKRLGVKRPQATDGRWTAPVIILVACGGYRPRSQRGRDSNGLPKMGMRQKKTRKRPKGRK